jgi:hypothetical protein
MRDTVSSFGRCLRNPISGASRRIGSSLGPTSRNLRYFDGGSTAEDDVRGRGALRCLLRPVVDIECLIDERGDAVDATN